MSSRDDVTPAWDDEAKRHYREIFAAFDRIELDHVVPDGRPKAGHVAAADQAVAEVRSICQRIAGVHDPILMDAVFKYLEAKADLLTAVFNAYRRR